jgi:ABC-type phosphate transport system substrate-binding protein
MTKFAFILVVLPAFLSESRAQILVISHKNVPVTQIGKPDILDYYTGDKRLWEDGTKVVLYDLKPRSQIKDAFYQFLGKSTSRMKSIWLKNKLSGEAMPPVGLETEAEIIAHVASTPGAIGYIRESMLTAEVKVLLEINVN